MKHTQHVYTGVAKIIKRGRQAEQAREGVMVFLPPTIGDFWKRNVLKLCALFIYLFYYYYYYYFFFFLNMKWGRDRMSVLTEITTPLRSRGCHGPLFSYAIACMGITLASTLGFLVSKANSPSGPSILLPLELGRRSGRGSCWRRCKESVV